MAGYVSIFVWTIAGEPTYFVARSVKTTGLIVGVCFWHAVWVNTVQERGSATRGEVPAWQFRPVKQYTATVAEAGAAATAMLAVRDDGCSNSRG